MEVNCETDFVARTEDFQAFVRAVVKQVAQEAAGEVERTGADEGYFDGHGLSGLLVWGLGASLQHRPPPVGKDGRTAGSHRAPSLTGRIPYIVGPVDRVTRAIFIVRVGATWRG